MRRYAAAIVVATLVGGLTVFGSTGPAYACICVEATDREYFDREDLVAIGTIRDRTSRFVTPEPPTTPAPSPWDSLSDAVSAGLTFTIWSLDIEDVQKGPRLSTIDLQGYTGSGCHYPFEKGRRYQVFATRQGSTFSTSICSGTRDLSAAAAYLPAAQTTAAPPDEDDGLSRILLLGDVGMVLVLLAALLLGPPLLAKRRRDRSGDDRADG